MTTLNTSLASSPLDPRIEISTPSVNEDFTLPSTGIKKGQRVTMINNGANSGSYPIITMKSSDGDVVRQVYPQTDGTVVALQDAPTDGSHWAGLGPVASNWMAYTPTGAWNTNVTFTGLWRRMGDSLEVTGRLVCSGAPNAATFTWGLPSGLVIDVTKIDNNVAVLGQARVVDNGVAAYASTVVYSSTTTVNLSVTNDGGGGTSQYGIDANVNQATPFTFGTNDNVFVNFKAPISGWSVTKG